MNNIILKDGSLLELNRGYKMDCLELMKQLPDNCIDLVLTDPPYGIDRSGQQETKCKEKKHNRKYYSDKKWDRKTPSKEVFDEIFRVSKHQIIWGGNYFVKYLNPSMGWIFWDKGQELSMSDGELAFTSFNKALRKKVINRGIINIDGAIHPTQKPLKLFKWCLEKYAMPIIEKQKIDLKDFIVADFFGGSFTTGCASHDYGFSWIITETDEDYFIDGTKRVKEYQKQERLNF